MKTWAEKMIDELKDDPEFMIMCNEEIHSWNGTHSADPMRVKDRGSTITIGEYAERMISRYPLSYKRLKHQLRGTK